MRTHSRPITLIIGTDVAIIGTGGACQIKTTVGSFLTGVTLGLQTGASCVNRTAPPTAGVAAVAEKPIIAATVIIGVLT